jgi:hypothetical protein
MGFVTLVAALAPSAGVQAALKAEVGSEAPAVEPSQWLNAPGNISWQNLKGRVVLLEKWATW